MLRRNNLMGGGSIKLPPGYVKLQYLDNGGTGYIDTGFKPNQDTRVVMSAHVLDGSNVDWITLFGARSESYARCFGAFVPGALTTTAQQYMFNYGGPESYYVDTNSFQKRSVDFNKNVISVDGVVAITAPVTTFQTSVSLYLCATNDDNVPSFLHNIRIYSCKIYNNGVKERDYVPCMNFYGKEGLYDLVDETFYPLLPATYTKVEYAESDGKSYIDTGFKPNQDTRVVCDYEVTAVPTTSRAIYGCTNGSNYYGVFLSTSNFTNVWYNTSMKDEDSVVCRKVIDQNKNKAQIFDGLSSNTYNWTYTNFSFAYNMYLFACNGSSLSYVGSSRIYSCQIYDNDTIIRDYIPMKNSSGTVGLYDLVNNVFYTFKPAITITWSIRSGSWTKGTQSSAADGIKYTSVSPGASGSTVLRCTFSGATSVTFNCVYNGESNYDYLTVGAIDTACTRSSYGTTLKGTSGTAKNIAFSCTTASHYVEFCYSKDGSVDTSPDCAVVYIKEIK